MQLFLMIAAALLISAYSAPTAESPMNSKEEKETTKSEYNFIDIWYPLENITQIELPNEDKKILCDFLSTFVSKDMQLLENILVINAAYHLNVKNRARNYLRKYEEEDPDDHSIKEFLQILNFSMGGFNTEDSDQKKKFHHDMGKEFEKIDEYFIKESQKIKSSLSRETVESEEEFFEKFKAFEDPSKNNFIDKRNLIYIIEKQSKYRYQC